MRINFFPITNPNPKTLTLTQTPTLLVNQGVITGGAQYEQEIKLPNL